MTALSELASKIGQGEPLSTAEVEALGASPDIITLGMMATSVRRKRHGTTATFVRVADVGIDEVSVAAPSRWSPANSPGELRLIGVPGTLEAAVAAVDRVREMSGDITVSAFDLADLQRLGERLPAVFDALRQAGLERIAFASLDRLADAEHSLSAAEGAGLEVSRLSMAEAPAGPWAAICLRVAELQKRLTTIRVFAPLPRRMDEAQPTTGYADVKRVALSRLLAGDVQTIQVDWQLYGPKLAQVALGFGADDIDSVSAAADGELGRRRSPLEEIERNIRAAGLDPVERDGRHAVRRAPR